MGVEFSSFLPYSILKRIQYPKRKILSCGDRYRTCFDPILLGSSPRGHFLTHRNVWNGTWFDENNSAAGQFLFLFNFIIVIFIHLLIPWTLSFIVLLCLRFFQMFSMQFNLTKSILSPMLSLMFLLFSFFSVRTFFTALSISIRLKPSQSSLF